MLQLKKKKQNNQALREMGRTRDAAARLLWAVSLLSCSPNTAESASSSSTETSAQSEAVSCALHSAGLQKHFIQSVLSEFQAAVKVFVWA